MQNSYENYFESKDGQENLIQYFQTAYLAMHDMAPHFLTHKIRISTAESCSGGLLSTTFTLLSGSSNYYMGSIISYSNDVKQNMLKVEEDTLLYQGAVSLSTVQQMAKNVAMQTKSHIGIALSGISGPSGGTKEKPVGTVCIALAYTSDIFQQNKQTAPCPNLQTNQQNSSYNNTNKLYSAFASRLSTLGNGSWQEKTHDLSTASLLESSPKMHRDGFDILAHKFFFYGDREQIRQQACLTALSMLYQNIILPLE